MAAIQIAKAVGARVIATAGTTEKLEVCKRYGADECINYDTNPEWWNTVLELTGGKDKGGVDVVFDSVGLVEKSIKCAKTRGRIIIVGFTGREGNMEKVAMNRILLKQINVIGYVSLACYNYKSRNTNNLYFRDMVISLSGFQKRPKRSLKAQWR